MRDLYSVDSYKFSDSGVIFKTKDEKLQSVFDKAEEICKMNRRVYGDYNVLIEGAKYNGVWLETQPMGGEMYAKRSIETALGNILIFLRYQRMDGKFPGMISPGSAWSGIITHYDWMQGCFLPHAALKLYYLIGKDKEYLEVLYNGLKKFDDYLWQYRDSDGDGCLESWCIWDTGEDNLTIHILNGINMPEDGAWAANTPPKKRGNMPYESAQYMSYSYACRDVLSKVSEILANGEDEEWRTKAKAVQDKFYDYLWDKGRGASYDRDKNNEMMYILTQANIKCMYGGIFTQEMADEFIARHLLNPEEFWTPYPLPSIAENDYYFHANPKYSNCYEDLKKYMEDGHNHDIDDNSWSGPIEGLTYQRSISAMLNYAHHTEASMIGDKLLKLLREKQSFPAQFNPFTGEYCESVENTYGPMVLANLEYISLLYGVNIAYDKILWSGIDNQFDFEYTQKMFDNNYTLKCENGEYTASVNEKTLFTFTKGVRIETDMAGNIIKIYGSAEESVELKLCYSNKEYSANIGPNEQCGIDEDKLKLVKKIPFEVKL